MDKKKNKYNEMVKMVGAKEFRLEPEARANLIDLLHLGDMPSGLVGGAVRMLQSPKNEGEFKSMLRDIRKYRKK